MQFTAEMIAGLLNGTIVGDKNASVSTVSSIDGGKAGSLAYLTNPRYEQYIYTTEASIVLVDKTFEPKEEVKATLIKVENVAECVLNLLEMYNAAKPRKTGIAKMTSISEEATVGENCYVGDFAVIERGAKIGDNVQIYPQCYIGDNVTIGEGTKLYPGVKIYEGCRIGKNCILHAGSVIGADGFGFAPREVVYLLKEPAFSFINLYYCFFHFFFIYFCLDLYDFFPSTNFGLFLFFLSSCFRCKVRLSIRYFSYFLR